MVNYPAERLDITFAALADPTRRAILAHLSRGDRVVSDLAAPFDMSMPAISKHLVVLKKAGLLVQRKEGRSRPCRLVAAPMREAAGWLKNYQRFWEERLVALSQYLEQTAEPKEPR